MYEHLYEAGRRDSEFILGLGNFPRRWTYMMILLSLALVLGASASLVVYFYYGA